MLFYLKNITKYWNVAINGRILNCLLNHDELEKNSILTYFYSLVIYENQN